MDATGQPIYKSDRISPGTYQTYLVDDPCAVLMPIDYGKESFANLRIILKMVPMILECLLGKAERQILSF